MGLVLRPGMRLMRRLGVTSKFGLITVLLLVPMCLSLVSSYRAATTEISLTEREQHGLRYVRPLVGLVIDLAQTRNLAEAGHRPPSQAWMGLVGELDDVSALYGEDLGVHSAWLRVRSQVREVYADGTDPAQLPILAERAARATQDLVKQVADASNLTLDPQLDSRYLAAMLVTRLPALVLAASDAQSLLAASAGPPDALTLRVTAEAVKDAERQLTLDLTTAVGATTWSGLRPQVGDRAHELSVAVEQYSLVLAEAIRVGPNRPRPTTSDSLALSTAAGALGNALTSATDQLMARRIETIGRERTKPLLVTLLIMAAIFYLLMALFRATTTDVRSVLEDIRDVATGAVHESTALSGSDEFSQMSQAVVVARDRLTSLVGTLKYQATHDELTALGNRALFTDKVDEALAAVGARGPVAVVLVDLDGFKDVNDSFGHDLGDRLLRMVALRIHRAAPRRSVLARLGSDEYAVLVTDVRFTRAPADLLGRLQQGTSQPVDLDGRRIRIQMCMGLALAEPGQEVTGRELIRNADVALSFAKAQGKGHSAEFEQRMHDETQERTELSADLIGAVDRGEMHVLYQPIVDLQTETLHGVEALLRWTHPTRGPISPAVFIPLAEATGQIVPIGRWVLEQACRQQARWSREFPDQPPIAMEVNLATEQLTDADLVSDVLTTMRDTGIDPTSLVLEITESSLVRDITSTLSTLGQLSATGVRLALDDFGTGYSSLSYLRRLPATIFKIDQSFVRDQSEDGVALLRSVVELGRSQGMQIIAEGVEEPGQVARVRAFGCHLGQGFHWSKAVRAEDISRIVRAGGRLGPRARDGERAAPAPRVPVAPRRAADAAVNVRARAAIPAVPAQRRVPWWDAPEPHRASSIPIPTPRSAERGEQ